MIIFILCSLLLIFICLYFYNRVEVEKGERAFPQIKFNLTVREGDAQRLNLMRNNPSSR